LIENEEKTRDDKKLAGMTLPFASNRKYDPNVFISLKAILSYSICENAMMRILGKGLKFW
jgi:hypothetical protein